MYNFNNIVEAHPPFPSNPPTREAIAMAIDFSPDTNNVLVLWKESSGVNVESSSNACVEALINSPALHSGAMGFTFLAVKNG
jgi:hypothetical protein